MDAGSSVSAIVGKFAGKWPSAFVGPVGSEKACDGSKSMAEFHPAGTCKPCYYHLNMKRGCKHGDRCNFCHYPHPCWKDRLRPSKAKRASCKKKANNIDFASMANDPQDVVEEFFGQGEYMKIVVESRLRSFGEGMV